MNKTTHSMLVKKDIPNLMCDMFMVKTTVSQKKPDPYYVLK